MRLWITGANGFLGKSFQNGCKKKGIPYVSTSRNEVDISSMDQVYRFADQHSTEPITHIVNCAGLAHVDLAEKNPAAAFADNVIGPENLAKLAHKSKISVIHFSTEYIFNGCQSATDFDENTQPSPLGVYATTKREGELRVLESSSNSCIIRTSWLFGGEGKTFLSSLFERIKREKSLRIDADQKGRPTYVEDLVQVTFALLTHSGVFHYANRGLASRYEIALKMKNCALESGISFACDALIPMRSNEFSQINKRPNQCVLNTSKVEKLLKTPIRNWEDAVKELVSTQR